MQLWKRILYPSKPLLSKWYILNLLNPFPNKIFWLMFPQMCKFYLFLDGGGYGLVETQFVDDLVQIMDGFLELLNFGLFDPFRVFEFFDFLLVWLQFLFYDSLNFL